MPSRMAPLSAYELKVTLLGLATPIWRRLQVPSSIELCCLHTALQTAMGWTDIHLHQFEKDGKSWGVPESIGRHCQYNNRSGHRIDGWLHRRCEALYHLCLTSPWRSGRPAGAICKAMTAQT